MLPIGRLPQGHTPSQSEYARILPRYPGLAAVEHQAVGLQPSTAYGHGQVSVASAPELQTTGKKRELAQLTAEEKKQRRLKKNRESARGNSWHKQRKTRLHAWLHIH